ncbi:5260_t:CDS:2, partial [Scutellospora calospora]
MHEEIKKVEYILKQESNETNNYPNKQELEVNKMSIETTNIEESPRIELIEIEMTSVKTQGETKAITTTRNIAKKIRKREEQARLKLEKQARSELEDIYICR